MGLLTKDIETLPDAFVHILQTTYYAEKQITEALPTMIGKATAPELKQGLDAHLRETKNQVQISSDDSREGVASEKATFAVRRRRARGLPDLRLGPGPDASAGIDRRDPRNVARRRGTRHGRVARRRQPQRQTEQHGRCDPPGGERRSRHSKAGAFDRIDARHSTARQHGGRVGRATQVTTNRTHGFGRLTAFAVATLGSEFRP